MMARLKPLLWSVTVHMEPGRGGPVTYELRASTRFECYDHALENHRFALRIDPPKCLEPAALEVQQLELIS
jgi:hypothetical protein